MTSFIIVAPNQEIQDKKLLESFEVLKIDPLDRTYIRTEKETSLGIEHIKKLQEKIFLKPFKSEDKAIVIPQAELLTIPAQNALLKLLEEPPAHTFIFLLSTTRGVFLPTILSRCQLIEIKSHSQPYDDEEKKKVQQQFASWTKQNLGDALKQAEILAKDKDKTLQSLEKFIVIGESILREEIGDQKETSELAYQLQQLQKTYSTLKATNTSPRLTLEYLFLSFLKQ
jgi:DNA polymerase III delta prime subunit